MDAATISAEYRRLGYDQGWSFALTPVANMAKAKVILVGLNPGGGDSDEYGELWEFPHGNAYFDDRWIPGSTELMPLQRQVAALFDLLALAKDDVFAAQFVPFRSRGWKDLKNPEQALAFGVTLWGWVKSKSPAKLFLCLGAQAAVNIAGVLKATPDGPRLQSGWGRITIGRYVSPSGQVVVELPHLSRYLLFSMGAEPLAVAKKSILEACRPSSLTT